MRSLLLTITLLTAVIASAQKAVKISAQEIKPLIGKWEGTLTYLDYSSNKPYSMKANLNVVQGVNERTFLFSNIFPGETSANAVDTIMISQDGKMIDGEVVTVKRMLENGQLEMVTEIEGKDGNAQRAATIRHTYLLNSRIFSKIKSVRFAGEQNWLKRNEYRYTR